MIMKNRISVSEVAELMNVSEQFIKNRSSERESSLLVMQLRCQHNGLITLSHKNSQNTQESLCHRKENIMEGYKVFEPDWTCRGFQYEVGKDI